jgi:hypothetical protein
MLNSGNVWMTTGGIVALCQEKCLDENRVKVCMATGCMVNVYSMVEILHGNSEGDRCLNKN